jgi:hypothetical protein
MQKNLFAFTAIALGIGLSGAMAASETAIVNASLTVNGECEVIATGISATTDNFVGADVILAQTGSLSEDSFDNHPAAMTVDSASTIAVLCSASENGNTLTLTSSGASLSDGGSGTIGWAPEYAELATPETTNSIAADPGSSIALAGSENASLYQYIITAGVTADDIAEVNPGNYSGTITATVSYDTGTTP